MKDILFTVEGKTPPYLIPCEVLKRELRKKLHLRGRAKITNITITDSTVRVWTNRTMADGVVVVYKYSVREVLLICSVPESVISRVRFVRWDFDCLALYFV